MALIEEILSRLSEVKLQSAEEYYKFAIVEAWDNLHKFYAFLELALFEELNDKKLKPLAEEIIVKALRNACESFLLRLSPYLRKETVQKMLELIDKAKRREDFRQIIWQLNIFLERLGILKVEILRPGIKETEEAFLKKFKK